MRAAVPRLGSFDSTASGFVVFFFFLVSGKNGEGESACVGNFPLTPQSPNRCMSWVKPEDNWKAQPPTECWQATRVPKSGEKLFLGVITLNDSGEPAGFDNSYPLFYKTRLLSRGSESHGWIFLCVGTFLGMNSACWVLWEPNGCLCLL